MKKYDGLFEKTGPYSKEAMAKIKMGVFPSGPIDIRSNTLATAIANCPWAKEHTASGLLWHANSTVNAYKPDVSKLDEGLGAVANLESCDGQQGRLFTECGINMKIANPHSLYEIGAPDSAVIAHPIKKYNISKENLPEWQAAMLLDDDKNDYLFHRDGGLKGINLFRFGPNGKGEF